MVEPSVRRSVEPGVHSLHQSQENPSLPFEIWRSILQDVFNAKTDISHPPTYIYVLSPLHARYNTLQSLTVCKLWYRLALEIFLEDLQAETVDSLEGINKMLNKNPQLATCIERLSLSFPQFRNTVSDPRRPLLIDNSRLSPEELNEHRRNKRMNWHNYRPSDTRQASHWNKWQGLCRSLLSRCTGLMHIRVVFTSDYTTQNVARNARHYQTLFEPPDLRNEALLQGLLYSTNLRTLDFTDPSPLGAYGPSLACWKRLTEASIQLTPSFPEATVLPDTAFCPPTSLKTFRFHDSTGGKDAWPLASDLARCTDLTSLDLFLATLSPRIVPHNTQLAIGFLIKSYQHTLKTLVLGVSTSRSWHGEEELSSSFQPILEMLQPLHFAQLETLRLQGTNYSSNVFSCFDAEKLTLVEVQGLNSDHDTVLPGYRSLRPYSQEYWRKALSHRSLHNLKTLEVQSVGGLGTINSIGNLASACRAMGIELVHLTADPHLEP